MPTQEELEFAIEGRYAARVIHRRAADGRAGGQYPGAFLEVAANQDPLEIADRLAGPSRSADGFVRVPGVGEDEAKFQYQQPPVIIFELPALTPRDAGRKNCWSAALTGSTQPELGDGHALEQLHELKRPDQPHSGDLILAHAGGVAAIECDASGGRTRGNRRSC